VSPHSFASLRTGYQSRWTKPVFDVYHEAEFPRDWHSDVAARCAAKGVHFFTSAWDEDAIALLEELGVPAHKIGSGDVTNLPFIRRIAETGKPVLLSTGASTLAEVANAVDVVRSTGNEQVALLQCVVNYPSRPESANLRVLDTFAGAFGVVVGFSDHTLGDVVSLGAIARGARIIEKHFTLDRSAPGPDHPHSMEPGEFRVMVDRARELESALGTGHKVVQEEEEPSRLIMRRSLHTVRALAAGEVIGDEDLVALRPALGIPPGDHDIVVGRRAARDLEPYEAIRWADLA
jgi:N-acetylneuraminate synthase